MFNNSFTVLVIITFLSSLFSSCNNLESDIEVNLITPVTSEKEIAIIFIGSSKCSASQALEIKKIYSKIVSNIEEKALKAEISTTTIGISIDSDLNDGLEALFNTYNFEEVSVGNGYSNLNLQNYIWTSSNNVGAPFYPQILINERKYLIEPSSDPNSNLISPKILQDTTLFRAIGYIGLNNLANDTSFIDQIF